MTELSEVARESDRAIGAARATLVRAVRRAAAEGMTQQEIAREIGRSQPEVSRLLRFHGTTPLGRRLRAARREVHALISEAGGSNVRVFGSVATGDDGPASDIDLLFTMGRPLSLMELSTLEQRIADVVGADVDLLPDQAVRSALRQRIGEEAVAL